MLCTALTLPEAGDHGDGGGMAGVPLPVRQDTDNKGLPCSPSESILESRGAVLNSCLWEGGRGQEHSGMKTGDAQSEAGGTTQRGKLQLPGKCPLVLPGPENCTQQLP